MSEHGFCTEIQEQEMREAARAQARDILQNEARFLKDISSERMGFESEVAIHKDGVSSDELLRIRNAIVAEMSDCSDVELGATQIELRTPPLYTRDQHDLLLVSKCNFARLVKLAHRHGAQVLRIGANPFLPVKNTPRTYKLKYRLVPDYYNAHRSPSLDTRIGLGKEQIDIGDAAIVSCFQSFQVNLEACSFADACDKMNRSIMLAPYLLALCGNSRYLECLDSGMQDARMIAWEKSHNTRMQDIRLMAWERAFDTRSRDDLASGRKLRVGLPERYFHDLADYIDRALGFPFILHNPVAAFQIAIGMTWLDARVKFIGDSLVVELRLLPTQPRIEDECTLAFLYLAMLTESQQCSCEEFLPIEFVEENRLQAMLYGIRSTMWFQDENGKPERLPFEAGMKSEIRKAIDYLPDEASRRICRNFLNRAFRFGSPTDRLASTLHELGSEVDHKTMTQALTKTGMLI